MAKKVILFLFLLFSVECMAQISCAYEEQEAEYWRLEYWKLDSKVDKLRKEVERLRELESAEPISTTIGGNYDDLEVGYFYYDSSGDYRYRQIR